MLVIASSIYLQAQPRHCGTMQNLDANFSKDPSLMQKMEESEQRNQKWLHNYSKVKHSYNPSVTAKSAANRSSSISALCLNDNTFFTTVAAPTSLNQTVSPNPNCTYGGEFITVTGLVAGNIYDISTCGTDSFDTQLTIYSTGTSLPQAHNDDFCGSQSLISFNPLVSGNYNILVDEYPCSANTTCASLEITLVYTPRPIVTIPVVFHIIHNGEPVGTGLNISDAQILSQIDVLNEDFRRLNLDINSTPSAFKGASDDALIEFCLAQQDEFGFPTTGIERIQGSQLNYTSSSFDALEKPSSIWDRDKYLNFWTCGINLSGYAQFPGGADSTDGVVIAYDQVGNIGNVNPPFDLGRTATHEIGHWLNLRHIWGDASGCGTDDFVSDTPIQDIETPIGTCPTFPTTDACSVNYPGIMFYNQMDYSGDVCLTMFTIGQTSRMDAALFNDRSSLLTSSGCQPSTIGINSLNLSNFISVFPNPSNGIISVSVNGNIGNSQITVTDVCGQTVFETDSEKHEIPIDLSNQSIGVYFLKIITEKGTVIKKIVLNK